VDGFKFISSQIFIRPVKFLGSSPFLFFPKFLFSEFYQNPQGFTFSFASLIEFKISTGIFITKVRK